MKKILLIFSAILSVSFANSQTDASVIITGAMTGVVTSGSDGSFIATLPSGENIVATHITLPSGENVINIKKIFSNGSVATLKNLIIPSGAVTYANLKGLSCSSTGAFTCMFGEYTDLYLVKFNATGMIDWQKSINVPEVTSLYYTHTMDETPTGEYYISISSYGFMGIIKIDANGNLLWNKKLAGPRDDGKCPGFCSEVTLSGGCISTLKDESFETIINLAPDGSLLWSRSFGDFMYRWTKSIKADNLGNFYIMGTYSAPGATFVQKMDANGNFIYAKNISGTTSYDDAYVTNSNELILLSKSPSFKLTKFGAAGNIVWNKGIGAVTGGSGYYGSYGTLFSKSTSSNVSFLSMMDTSYVVFKFSGEPSELCNSYNFGIDNTTDDTQILAAEIDSTCNITPLIVNVGNTGFGTSVIEYFVSDDFCSFIASVNETVAVDLNIYPNPATDFVNIELGNLKNEDLQNAVIVVYDITGKKVFEKQLNTSSMEKISTADYATGLYTIVIANPDKMLAKQRVIVQK
ncbi:MAG TPA: T9SS type A sorting domain-containing protein [Bacteroidia bacterium]|nr:T9SS type A sorting domain-containing protein [Bacteroidia bacterium]